MDDTWIELVFLVLIGVPGVVVIVILRRALREQRERVLRGRARFARDFGFEWLPRRWKLSELPDMRGFHLFDGFAAMPSLDRWVPARVMRRSVPELWILDLGNSSLSAGPAGVRDFWWTLAYLRRPGLYLPRFWTSWDAGRWVPPPLDRLVSLETQPALEELRGPDGKPRYVHGDKPGGVRALLDHEAFRAALEASAFDVQACGDHLTVLYSGEDPGRRELEALLRSAERLGEVLDGLARAELRPH